MDALPPTFPKGLRVLLVDDEHNMPLVSAQLCQPELQYAVTMCGSASEALAYTRALPAAFDVILAESQLVATDELTGRAFVDAFDGVPVVLMSEGGDEGEVMRAVTMGAVDFLEKPLSVLKLKNIWQHAVRRMMQRTSFYDSDGHAPAAQAHSEPLLLPQYQCQPSISDYLPSSVSGPIGIAPPPLAKLSMLPPIPHRSSVDSPGTPSGADAIDPLESTTSADSASRLVALPSVSCREGRGARISLDTTDSFSLEAGMLDVADADILADMADANVLDMADLFDEDVGALEPPAKRAALEPTLFAPLMPVPPVASWPQLPAGCVWGTPVGGPLPPPMPPAAPAPAVWTPAPPDALAGLPPVPSSVLIRHEPVASPTPPLPPTSAAAAAAPGGGASCLPEAFLSSLRRAAAQGDVQGPLGLKLRKSSSLLDLVNSALGGRRDACCA